MRSIKKIYCTECGKPIEYKKDLLISSKILGPYHSACFMNPNKVSSKLNKFYGPFPLRSRFWIWLILGNLISGLIYILEANPSRLLYAFIVLCNIVFISARIGIYHTYEKHLM